MARAHTLAVLDGVNIRLAAVDQTAANKTVAVAPLVQSVEAVAVSLESALAPMPVRSPPTCVCVQSLTLSVVPAQQHPTFGELVRDFGYKQVYAVPLEKLIDSNTFPGELPPVFFLLTRRLVTLAMCRCFHPF